MSIISTRISINSMTINMTWFKSSIFGIAICMLAYLATLKYVPLKVICAPSDVGKFFSSFVFHTIFNDAPTNEIQY